MINKFLLYGFLVFVVFHPVLVGEKILGGSDVMWHLQAFASFKADLLKDNFLWNPNIFGGFPTFISIFGLLSPIHWIVLYFFDAVSAYHWLTFFGIIASAIFMDYFVQSLGVSKWGAFISGLAWMMSLKFHVQHLSIVYVYILLPLLFFLTYRKFSLNHDGNMVKEKERNIFWESTVVALGWLMGHWHWMIESVIAVFLWKRPYKVLLLGSIIGLVQLLPAFAYIGLADRTLGHWDKNGVTPFDIFLPFFPFFDLSFIPPVPELAVGVLPFFFAISMISANNLKDYILLPVKNEIFFSWLFILSLLLGFAYSPFFWLFQHIPPFQFLHLPGRWMFIGTFALSVLAGFGHDRKSQNKIFYWILVFVLAAVVGVNILGIFKNQSSEVIVRFFDAKYHEYVLKQIASFFFAFSNIKVFYSILMIGISLAALYWRKFVVGAVILNFLFIYGFTNDFSFIELEKPATAFVKGRTFSPLSSNEYVRLGVITEDEQRAADRDLLFPDGISVLWGIENIRYFDPLTSRPMKRAIETLSADFKNQRDLVNFLGIKNIITLIPLEEYEKIFQDGKIMIYENKEAKPLFYFLDNGRIKIIEKKNTRSILQVESEKQQPLIFSENRLPGWKAYINNQETPLFTVGGLFMGINIPEGKHEVKFEFTYKTIIAEFLSEYF